MDPGCSPRKLISRADIEAVVDRLAAEIAADYRDKHPVALGILKGAFIFMADLVRRLDFPLDLDFVRLSSYGAGKTTSGEVRLTECLNVPMEGRHVLVVEDIIDTGISISFLLEHLRGMDPASVRVCALMDKPSRRQVPVNIDYLGFVVPDRFLVGYGLDCNEEYRNLPDVCFLEIEE